MTENKSEDSGLTEIYDEFLQLSQKRLVLFHEARQTFIKSLLNLSAGSLVVTVTLIQVFGKEISNGLFLLPLTWTMFGIAIISSFIHIANDPDYWLIFNWFKLKEDQFGELASELDIDLSEYDSDATDWIKLKAFISIQEEKLEEESKFKLLDRTLYTAFLTFLIGLICLGIFASINLPW